MYRNLLILVAIFGLGWGASFGAGAALGRRSVPVPPAQAATIPFGQGAQGATGAQGGSGAAGGQGGAQGALLTRGGVVESIDGQTLTLRSPNNQQVRVRLNDQTQVLKQVEGTTADLTAGVSVLVQPQGQPGADGAVTAASITVVPANAAARLAGGAQGGSGAQRPGGQGGQGAQRSSG
jgi:hypothetical protein